MGATFWVRNGHGLAFLVDFLSFVLASRVVWMSLACVHDLGVIVWVICGDSDYGRLPNPCQHIGAFATLRGAKSFNGLGLGFENLIFVVIWSLVWVVMHSMCEECLLLHTFDPWSCLVLVVICNVRKGGFERRGRRLSLYHWESGRIQFLTFPSCGCKGRRWGYVHPFYHSVKAKED